MAKHPETLPAAQDKPAQAALMLPMEQDAVIADIEASLLRARSLLDAVERQLIRAKVALAAAN